MAKTPLDSHEKWLILCIPSRNPYYYPNMITKHIPLNPMKSHEIVGYPKKTILPFSNDDLSESVHSKFTNSRGFPSSRACARCEECPGGSVATGRGDRPSGSLGSAWGGKRQVLSAGAPVA